jgi:putative nucleotidyltransferase with HDIG domain
MNPQHKAANEICATLTRHGFRALLAGGCVRDMLLGCEPVDYDIATNARPEQVAALFPKTVGVGAAFGVMLVMRPEGAFEVATFRKDGAYLDGRHPAFVEFRDEEEDAKRRDFTINAMFYDPLRDELVDYVGGQEDLNREIIRTVGDPRQRFAEDHLRILRAIRFAARFGYDIDPATFDAIRDMAHLVLTTSAERIRDEIVKMLMEGGAKRAFELMDQTGVLKVVLPEIDAMKGCQQPPEFHPEGDVFVHTLLMLSLMDNPSPTLALGVLLHDVGKPLTQTFEDRIRFNNHDKVGARIAEHLMRRLHMSRDEIDRVSWLVDQHMRVAVAPEMRESKLKRFVRQEGFHELLELCRLDCLASHRNLDVIDWLKDYIANLKPEQVKPAPLLRGGDLIAMGYTPGPLFSEILTAVEDKQLEGELGSREGAEQFVRETWPLD